MRGQRCRPRIRRIFLTIATYLPFSIITNAGNPLSNYVGDISVWINFLPAPILSVAFLDGYQQINVQVPWEGQRDPLYVEVFQGDTRAHTEDTAAANFSVFFIDAKGYAVARHASDYSLVTAQNPAHPGEYVIVYGINLGPVSNTPASGAPSPFDPLARPLPFPGDCRRSDGIFVGAISVPLSFVGLAPGSLGVYQINFQVPPGTSGAVPLIYSRTRIVDVTGVCYSSGLGTESITDNSQPALLPVE